MDTHRLRNLIPPVYALAILGGFLISSAVGIIVLVVGGSLSGLLWSTLSGRRPAAPVDAGSRDERAAARAERRSERR